jgi:hypothetical protein
MKRHLGESMDHFARRAFMQRTGAAIKNHHARALKVKAKVGYTLDDVRNLVRLYVGKPCPYCGERIHTRNFSLDHAAPIVVGGEWDLANLAVTCVRCNKLKGRMLPAEMRGLMILLKAFTPEGRRDVTMRLLMGGSRMQQVFRPGQKAGGAAVQMEIASPCEVV